MSQLIPFDRHRPLAPDAVATREIERFDAIAANDNGPSGAHRHAALWLPAIAFASGLGAALLIAAAVHAYGYSS